MLVQVRRLGVYLAAALALMAGCVPTGCQSGRTPSSTSGVSNAAGASVSTNYIRSTPESFRRLLSPPPEAGDPQERCEMEAILIAQAEVTPATRDRVKIEESLSPSVFDAAAGLAISKAATPLTFGVLTRAQADVRVVSNEAKAWWTRARPSTREPRIAPLVEVPTNSGYPSGHATLAVVWSGLLAELAPPRREDLERRARLVAWDRVIAGVHYPSDVAAGAVLGEAMVREMLRSPELQRELAAARAEWPAHR